MGIQSSLTTKENSNWLVFILLVGFLGILNLAIGLPDWGWGPSGDAGVISITPASSASGDLRVIN